MGCDFLLLSTILSASNEALERRERHTVLNKIKTPIISVLLVMDVGNAINLLFSHAMN